MDERTLNTHDLEVFQSEGENCRGEKTVNWTTTCLDGMISSRKKLKPELI
jgi:hypothetical protein